jgi:hypothetical protein
MKSAAVALAVLLSSFVSAQTVPDIVRKSVTFVEVFTVTDLGPNVSPVGINARGQVAASGLCPTCGPNQQALLWRASNGLKDVGATRITSSARAPHLD